MPSTDRRTRRVDRPLEGPRYEPYAIPPAPLGFDSAPASDAPYLPPNAPVGLVVEESDGSPRISSVTRIQFAGGVVTNPEPGVALFTAAGGGDVPFVGAWAKPAIKGSTSSFLLEWNARLGAATLTNTTIGGRAVTVFTAPESGVYHIAVGLQVGIAGTNQSWYPRVEAHTASNGTEPDWQLSNYLVAGHEIPLADAGGVDVEWALSEYIMLAGNLTIPLLSGATFWLELAHSSGGANVYTGGGNLSIFRVAAYPA